MGLKTYKIAMSILTKFLTLKLNISRTIWRIEVGDGSFFCISHALSFELNFFFDRRFPLNSKVTFLGHHIEHFEYSLVFQSHQFIPGMPVPVYCTYYELHIVS